MGDNNSYSQELLARIQRTKGLNQVKEARDGFFKKMQQHVGDSRRERALDTGWGQWVLSVSEP